MITVTRVHELRTACDDARQAGRRVGLVPTMGFFHAGHRSLMRAARADNDLVVLSFRNAQWHEVLRVKQSWCLDAKKPKG
jgi:pantothenate synthetase